MKAVFYKQDGDWFFAGTAEDTAGLEASVSERGLEGRVFDLDPVEEPTP